MRVFRLIERIPLVGDLFRFLQRRRAMTALSRTPPVAVRPERLRRMSEAELADAVACPGADCAALDQRLEVTRRVIGPGVVNAGDRLALAHLVFRLRPLKILEVGTHAGASTLSMAVALAATGEGVVDTVDIVDVNAAGERKRAGLDPGTSPRQLLRSLDLEDRVRFITSDGLDYLHRTKETYDLVFLDGDHSAVTVYQEIPAALNRLSNSGVIVLHDYFPAGRPLWSDGRVEQGPWLAVRRLQCEGADVEAMPLGALPWRTKLGSSITSLALLTQSTTE
jgi:predicted O-methyltransferase YrrM